jgi:DHA1 family tetracycline resistance protein-like MFS transporter
LGRIEKSQVLLIITPVNGYNFLTISIVIEGCCLVTINPLVDQLIVLSIDSEERARIQSILFVTVIIITTHFGWIAGSMFAVNKALPFIFNFVLFIVGGVITWLAGKTSNINEDGPQVSYSNSSI